MAKLTREQAQKWSAKAHNGFKFDVRHYVIWNEKQLTMVLPLDDGDKLEAVIRFREKGDRFYTGITGYVPGLNVTRWHPSTVEGVYTAHGLGKWEPLGELQQKRSYDLLCKLSANVTAEYILDKYGDMQGTTLAGKEIA